MLVRATWCGSRPTPKGWTGPSGGSVPRATARSALSLFPAARWDAAPRRCASGLRRLGSGGEVFSEDVPMVALTAPAGADFAGLKALLDHGQENGWWHYELGCVTDDWRNA
ncbi:DUF4265 domain-containing protein [Nonomuraea dietziae]|uniref:DUF4265 domain-containing protein n=1 Tax=Nonomuraea dietziae TaxID=65515 RepID=UPI003F4E42D2